MTTNYTIYLVNQSSTTQTFWCFLTRPQELASDPNVFANSSASLAIRSNDPSTNSFTIPVQYVVAAGASNQAVGLNVQINSSISQNADLGQIWEAKYENAPPKMGPSLTLDSSSVGPKSLKIVTNPFNQEQNEALNWFSNQSFGIETESGFMGMTWSPSPNQSRTLTPKLSFYVSAGSFGDSELADWTQVSNNAAQVSVPTSFSANACTVTYLNNGTWSVTPGKPPQMLFKENLSLLGTEDIAQLLALSYIDTNKIQQDTVKSVYWKNTTEALDAETEEEGEAALLTNTFLTGTVTVTAALTAAFTYFVLSGVQFTVIGNPQGTTVNFTYNGTMSAQAVQNLLVAGAQIVFGGAN
ncbi:hypothetical protein [uncultured Sphingomonas sp.]|uniref:hypothetical protein n=1 Tax=uncultured Sphingomonas sp. TaxID=158754 RepID=UPI0025D56103|nr:hypothetical protein [uncultured Sphingomonas sp.]